jgi:aerobic carbon-monoxide dehydrogenase medium subunit
MKAPPFEYIRPANLQDAIAALAKHGPDAKAIAGGQSLVPMLAFRLTAPRFLVDIGRIPDLNRIVIEDNAIRLGALVRWRDIERSAPLRPAHPLLCEAVRHVAHYQIRNRGTVGGSLAHADPAAELPGIAVTCDATIVLESPRGQRTIAAREFFLAALSTALAPDELIVELSLPPWSPNRRWSFVEFARRIGDFALAGVAVFYDVGPNGQAINVHIGAIGVAPIPLRLIAVEAVLEGGAITESLIRATGAAASASVDPAEDIHAPGEYRRALLGVLTERAVAKAAGITLREDDA